MIGLDTNVIVRYIVQDDAKQSAKSTKIIEALAAKDETIAISQITLCEIVWVLERCYQASREEIIRVLNQIMHIKQIKIEHENTARLALKDFTNISGVDFSDCIIGRQNLSRGCEYTYTFDKNAAKKLPELFKLIERIE